MRSRTGGGCRRRRCRCVGWLASGAGGVGSSDGRAPLPRFPVSVRRPRAARCPDDGRTLAGACGLAVRSVGWRRCGRSAARPPGAFALPLKSCVPPGALGNSTPTSWTTPHGASPPPGGRMAAPSPSDGKSAPLNRPGGTTRSSPRSSTAAWCTARSAPTAPAGRSSASAGCCAGSAWRAASSLWTPALLPEHRPADRRQRRRLRRGGQGQPLDAARRVPHPRLGRRKTAGLTRSARRRAYHDMISGLAPVSASAATPALVVWRPRENRRPQC